MSDLTDHDLLIRIDERTEAMENHLKGINGKIIEHDQELHDKGGLCDRLMTTETKQKTNRILIYALWALIASIAVAIFSFFMAHLQGKL